MFTVITDVPTAVTIPEDCSLVGVMSDDFCFVTKNPTFTYNDFLNYAPTADNEVLDELIVATADTIQPTFGLNFPLRRGDTVYVSCKSAGGPLYVQLFLEPTSAEDGS